MPNLYKLFTLTVAGLLLLVSLYAGGYAYYFVWLEPTGIQLTTGEPLSRAQLVDMVLKAIATANEVHPTPVDATPTSGEPGPN